MHTLGILGGTFDPVHCGHLRLAIEMRERLDLACVALVPAARPALRGAPSASASVRLRMLEAAIDGVPKLCVDDREIRRDGPSYTVDTLRAIRAERGPGWALCLILGMDAFAHLERWHQWREIPKLAHLCLARRPGTALPAGGELGTLIAERAPRNRDALGKRSCGCVLVCDIPPLEVSATHIRRLVSQGRSARFLLPDAVHDIIESNGLYREK